MVPTEVGDHEVCLRRDRIQLVEVVHRLRTIAHGDGGVDEYVEYAVKAVRETAADHAIERLLEVVPRFRRLVLCDQEFAAGGVERLAARLRADVELGGDCRGPLDVTVGDQHLAGRVLHPPFEHSRLALTKVPRHVRHAFERIVPSAFEVADDDLGGLQLAGDAQPAIADPEEGGGVEGLACAVAS